MAKQKNDLYQDVTNQIIEAMEKALKDGGNWNDIKDNRLPINFNSNNTYQGINVVLLSLAQMKNKFSSSCWMTYKQAKSKGGQVIKGEKSTRIIFYKTLEIDNGNVDKTTGDPVKDKIPMIRRFNVFNLDQIEGVEEPSKTYLNDGEIIENAENLLFSSGVSIVEKQTNRAYYVPSQDRIRLPSRKQFNSIKDFYAVGLHELTHATGHKSRCDRQDYDEKNKDISYAFEELVAELGAAFSMSGLGLLGNVDNHACYLKSWLSLLKKDKKAIFKAASLAQKAHSWIIETAEIEKIKVA